MGPSLVGLDDSITESGIIEDEDDDIDNEHLNLLQLSKAIKIHAFNYLEQSQLAKVQTVCRCLCVSARNPNALYHLIVGRSRIQDYRHTMYSRVKSLKMVSFDRAIYEPNTKWFQSVTRCSLSNNAGFFLTHIDFEQITHLTLRADGLTRQMNEYLNGILQCVNSESLVVFPFAY